VYERTYRVVLRFSLSMLFAVELPLMSLRCYVWTTQRVQIDLCRDTVLVLLVLEEMDAR